MEKLKKDFKADRISWEFDKAAMLKRAEEAEAALKSLPEELSSLKHQINTMTVAVFGKLHYSNFLPNMQLNNHSLGLLICLVMQALEWPILV